LGSSGSQPPAPVDVALASVNDHDDVSVAERTRIRAEEGREEAEAATPLTAAAARDARANIADQRGGGVRAAARGWYVLACRRRGVRESAEGLDADVASK